MSDVVPAEVTHFDADHIGGPSAFPDAQVHLTADEARGAATPPPGVGGSASSRCGGRTARAPSRTSRPSTKRPTPSNGRGDG
ncbi:hypothetical protein [Streptomyces zaehneri]|uniref:hypothetical protein n=1 Tax=Streptomyces zaehneri TaxID=3051180 RepID=UPI0028D237ED|nr:hypothetical protein [Streptomyces sp. DSM 40713]